jgi:RNA polymerase sigma-70 factor (ECF subfamily)
VDLAASDVHVVGDGVRELRRDGADLPAHAAEVVQEAGAVGGKLRQELGELQDVDSADDRRENRGLGLARTAIVAHSETVAPLRLAQERAVAAVPAIGRADTGAATGRPASADAHAEVLYERLYDRVFGYCLYQLGSREEAEDATQVTFVQALRGLRRGVVPRVETAWVFAIAKNVCLERHQVRGKRRAREVLLDPADLELEAVEDERHGEETARLREALEHLSDQQREAVLLREWRGLSYREIAAEMGVSLSAVETLIFRARRSLAEQLSEETGRTRVAHGLLLGPLAAALKSFGGPVAKVAIAAALAAATVTGGVLIGSGATDAPRRPAVEAPALVPPAAEPTFLWPSAVPHAPAQSQADEPAKAKGASKKGETKTTSGEPGIVPGPGDHVLAPADDLVDDVVGGVVEPVLEPVWPLVDELESTLDPVLNGVPQLPQLQLP